MRRLALILLPLALSMLSGSATQAALKKFQIFTVDINEQEDQSPIVRVFFDDDPVRDTALVDDTTTPGSPVLVKFRERANGTVTVIAPGFAGGAFIFLSENNIQGPGGVVTQKPSTFTGTGSTAAGSTIAWGIVTGWSITGTAWCRSAPPVLCDFANRTHETSTEPEHTSDFYDLGTWTFHSTGFTGSLFIARYTTIGFGNLQRWYRGFFITDATVPALPLFGVALLGASLALGAAASLRRRRDKE